MTRMTVTRGGGGCGGRDGGGCASVEVSGKLRAWVEVRLNGLVAGVGVKLWDGVGDASPVVDGFPGDDEKRDFVELLDSALLVVSRLGSEEELWGFVDDGDDDCVTVVEVLMVTRLVSCTEEL